MTATVQLRGRYELFETPDSNRILVLDDDRWYAWVEGQQGQILVRSDSGHEKARTLQRGDHYLVHFDGDPRFTDLPHLFLQRGELFQELILPNGLPTEDDVQKRVILADDTIATPELLSHLEGTGGSRGTARESAAGRETHPAAGHDAAPGHRTGAGDVAVERELPIPDFEELSVKAATRRLDDLSPSDLRRLRSWEEEHKQRKSLIQQIDRRLR